ncbi:MAG TPA: hypothetical protein VGX51_10430 [Solirubrobacteraceae bacterium]|jgi:hypothetical protein|nr:hypothetical protein [Solirubrobacteraceae bacterium]
MSDYVEYGSLATVPGPLRCEGVTQWCFPLLADRECLAELCRRTFAEPTGGEIDLRPLGSHVIFSLGRVERIVSEQQRFATMGWASETQGAIWVPVGRVHDEHETAVVEEMLMFTPYMWVDNPISLASGREMYGFAKAFGWFDLPAPGADAAAFELDAFGMDFETDQQPQRNPLVRVTRGAPVHEVTELVWSGLRQVGRHLRQLTDRDGRPSIHFGWRFAESVLANMIEGSVRQVFLHQARAIGDGSRASLQQVAEASYSVSSLRAAPLEHEYVVDISELSSAPLVSELGLESHSTTRFAYRSECNFKLGTGSVLWDAAAPASVKA